jgi:ABC-type antimicrobial peptide transport system permease subunit
LNLGGFRQHENRLRDVNVFARALLVSSAITSVIMAVVGVLACAGPARRALRIQPTEALRQN